MMAEKLLRSRKRDALEDHQVTQVITKLTSELYYHGHPISREEARNDLGLSFVKDATPAVADAMWKLFEAYEADMRLNTSFLPVQEVVARDGLPAVPNPAQQITTQDGALGPLPAVMVESVQRSDVLNNQFQVTVRRDVIGRVEGNIFLLAQAWSDEP
jgi:hypothetical protein